MLTAHIDEAPIVERTFAVLVIVLSTGGPLPLVQSVLNGSSISGSESNPFTVVLWAALYAVALLLAWRVRSRFVNAAVASWPVLGVVALAHFSVLWSSDADLTLRRAVALLGTSIVGWYLAARFSPTALLRLVASSLLLTVVLSTLAVLIPGIGYDAVYASTLENASRPAARGIYLTKNALAQVMTLAAPCLLTVACSARGTARVAYAAGGIGALSLVALSGSATGLVLTGMMCTSIPILLLFRAPPLLAAAGTSGVLLALTFAGMFLSQHLHGILALTGRDLTLTGRTHLWSSVLHMVSERPWLGWGHGAFWRDWSGYESSRVLEMAGWEAGYAHNGFLDQLLGVGSIGLLLLLILLLNVARLAGRWLRSERQTSLAVWPAVLLLFLVLSNLTEGGLVQQNAYMWLLLVAVSSQVAAIRATSSRYAHC